MNGSCPYPGTWFNLANCVIAEELPGTLRFQIGDSLYLSPQYAQQGPSYLDLIMVRLDFIQDSIQTLMLLWVATATTI